MLKIHFAPLQGYTESPYRRIHSQVCGGIDVYYTPFIRLEHGQIRKKDLREALPENNQGVTVIPQVIASDAGEFIPLVEKLAAIGHRRVDVNMGCPFPLQTRLGRGSGILPHPDKVAGILTALRRFHEEQGIRFSIKMRLGQESADEAFVLLPLLNDTPLEHITLHPRVGRAQYKGELDMEAFRRFHGECSQPLVFNGLILTIGDIQRIESEFPDLAGVMIGRGLLSRPTLAAEYLSGQPLSDLEVRRRALEMHRQLYAHYEQNIDGGDTQLMQKMQPFWDYMEPLFDHKLVKKVLKAGSLRNYREAVANVR